MIQNVDHQSAMCRYRAMLIPFGMYKNSLIGELRKGDSIRTTFDLTPIECEVLEVSKIPLKSATANALSWLIYGVPIEVAFKVMKQNHKKDIQDRFIYLISYREI